MSCGKALFYTFILCAGIMAAPSPARALVLPPELLCNAADTLCVLRAAAQQAASIREDKWRDQTLRDIAMQFAEANHPQDAYPLIGRITNPDTKAMAIRGIGMGVAKYAATTTKDEYDAIFTQLAKEAETIGHEGARAIAYTYIAMAQAFAGLDDAATKTAAAMTNQALRNKAFGESAEIQAERGDIDAAMASIRHIDDAAFRDKAHQTTAMIFIKEEAYAKALDMAARIGDPYKKTLVMVAIADAQTTKMQKEKGLTLSPAAPAPTDKGGAE